MEAREHMTAISKVMETIKLSGVILNPLSVFLKDTKLMSTYKYVHHRDWAYTCLMNINTESNTRFKNIQKNKQYSKKHLQRDLEAFTVDYALHRLQK